MHKYPRKLMVLCFAASLLAASCKKDKSEASVAPPPVVPPTGASAADKVKDTALLYSRDIYLWYQQIPGSFNARSYSDPSTLLAAIRTHSVEPGFATPVDRWSFATKKAEWDNVSSGVAGDFGLGVFFNNTTDLRVKSVEAASPAGKAGVRRGWRITKINGNTNISTTNTDFIITTVFNSTSTTFTFQRPDGSSADVTLTAATYQENPVYFDSVYTVTGGKLGYLVLNSFLGDTTAIYNDFRRVFDKFAAAGVNQVAVDLRYNGGGYVSVQEKLANYLVKSAASGQLMMKQQFNDKYAQFNSQSNFAKLGGLNPTRLFFLVSNSTASASELLINNLKPHMEVLVVGPSKTYGKPVGYFPIPVGDWYIFPVSFRTTNKNGEGSYFAGLPLNHTVNDGLDRDWGSTEEAAFASVLRYSNGGTFRSAGPAFEEKLVLQTPNTALGATSFKGAVDSRNIKL